MPSDCDNNVRCNQSEFFGAWPKENTLGKKIIAEQRYANFAGIDTENGHINCSQNQVRFIRPRLRKKISLDLIPENPFQESLDTTDFDRCAAGALYKKATTSSRTQNGFVHKCLLFVPNLLIKISLAILRYILYIPLSIAAPSFWLSAALWIFWKILHIPVNFLKWILSGSCKNPEVNLESSPFASSVKRTVLISCGSTIQTLHLARYFYASGARVIVFEFDDLFGLARFSAAVDKFYMVPRPTPEITSNYIDALCHIVRKEKPSIYIPVCATSPAYYDALAKPYLELLGCASFIPGVQETMILDDCMQFFQKCSTHDIQLPTHFLLSSLDDLLKLYSNGFIGNFRNILIAVGIQGLLQRFKYILPNKRQDFKFNHDVNEHRQWLLVRDVPGDHYVTCTTVKDSRVVANVTCSVENDTKNLMSVISSNASQAYEGEEIETWLKTFFAKVRFPRHINGHFSFRMVRCQRSGKLLPLGIRIGVSLPYICYNQSQSPILNRTMKCAHMKPIDIYKREKSMLHTIGVKWDFSAQKDPNAVMALNKREALFAYWDPLPYCAFYHLQLPLKSVKLFLQKRHHSTKKTKMSQRMAMPVN